MQSSVTALFTLSVLATSIQGFNNPHYVPGHDGMVHLFEWKWSDIAVECESFLGPMGFGGVQVSPVQENVIVAPRPWWERYQPISYLSHTRSGNETELRDMVRRCNAVGVRIYVDAVINHMSADQPSSSIGTGGSLAYPSSKNYPAVPYTSADFHRTCAINNYNDPVEVRNCELVGLHDLDHSIETVRQKIVGFMNGLIDLGVAGFRIDAAKHMWPHDLQVIYSRLHNLNTEHGFQKDSRPYIYQEVIDMGGEGVNKYEYNNMAAVTEFRYGMEVSRGVRGLNPLSWYSDIGELWSMLPDKDALIFIDNHDNQRTDSRVLNYKQPRLYKMAVAFMLAHPYGNPQIMSSFAFEYPDQSPPADANGNLASPVAGGICSKGWVCEHRWRQIFNMIRFRNAVNRTEITEWWDNGGNQIAFARGNAGFIAINADDVDLKANIQTRLPPGTYCDVISGTIVNGRCSGKIVIVNSFGHANISIPVDAEDGVLAIHIRAKL